MHQPCAVRHPDRAQGRHRRGTRVWQMSGDTHTHANPVIVSVESTPGRPDLDAFPCGGCRFFLHTKERCGKACRMKKLS